MTDPDPSAVQLGEYRTSRWAALFTLAFTAVVWPWSIRLAPSALSTIKRKSLLFPWVRESEQMTYDSVASVRHKSGIIWDTVIVESRGGSNDLDLPGLRKRDAASIVRALHAIIE